MDPRNPTVWEARRANSEYIVYYDGILIGSTWIMVRVANQKVMARGTLEEMLDLLTLYPNSRRATLGEDILRNPAKIFYYEYSYGLQHYINPCCAS